MRFQYQILLTALAAGALAAPTTSPVPDKALGNFKISASKRQAALADSHREVSRIVNKYNRLDILLVPDDDPTKVTLVQVPDPSISATVTLHLASPSRHSTSLSDIHEAESEISRTATPFALQDPKESTAQASSFVSVLSPPSMRSLVSRTAQSSSGSLGVSSISSSLRSPPSSQAPIRSSVSLSSAATASTWSIISTKPADARSSRVFTNPSSADTAMIRQTSTKCSDARASRASTSLQVIHSASTRSISKTNSANSRPSRSILNQKAAGTAIAKEENNGAEYLSPVVIGGQTLMLDFDTGSGDFWVFNTELSQDLIGARSNVFDPAKSTTWSAAKDQTWAVSYGDDSSASGYVGYDDVNIGSVTANHQAIGLALTVSKQFMADTATDGIVGLALSGSLTNTVRPQPQKTFFENVMDDLDLPLFTADLHLHGGTYEFGVIDSTKYRGDIHYTTIDTRKGLWEFAAPSYMINGQRYTGADISPAVADTGTTLLLMDDSIAAAYYAQVPGASLSKDAGGYVFPCDDKQTVRNLPDFGIEIGDSGFTAMILGADMVSDQIATGTCFGNLQSNSGIGLQVLGDVLFKKYFAVFNGGEKTFGLALKAA